MKQSKVFLTCFSQLDITHFPLLKEERTSEAIAQNKSRQHLTPLSYLRQRVCLPIHSLALLNIYLLFKNFSPLCLHHNTFYFSYIYYCNMLPFIYLGYTVELLVTLWNFLQIFYSVACALYCEFWYSCRCDGLHWCAMLA